MEKKYTIILNKFPTYSRILKKIRKLFESTEDNDYLVVPYILMCANTLEARLNDEIDNHICDTFNHLQPGISKTYQKLNFKDKLDIIAPLLTNNEYTLNKNHEVYQKLVALIKLRNHLVHPKRVERFFERPESSCPEWPFNYPPMPKAIVDEIMDFTLGAATPFTPIEYHDAILKLEKWFFHRCPDRLLKVALVTKNIKTESCSSTPPAAAPCPAPPQSS